MSDPVLDIISVLNKLDMIKGYGETRYGSPYAGGEDLMWDFADVDCTVGIILEELRMLTDTQRMYVELEAKKDEYKKFIEELKEATQALVNEMGVGGHFQDMAGTVYQVDDAKGRYVHFDKFEVKRTRRGEEKSGSLALGKARDLGYEVK